MLYPLTFKPIFQERIWGGRNLETLYGKQLPEGRKIGESWEISDREDAQSIIAEGPLAGKSLQWLMENHGQELLGEVNGRTGRFPLLVKILDAEEKLSLQVHPPASKAAQFHGEAKTEMWYITRAQPGAELYVGLKRGVTREAFLKAIQEGVVANCFHRVPVKTGDAMFLPSGRVHAIGAGLVIFEIQQNSDTTFRVFDWNRVDSSGNTRQLHVKESLECIDFGDTEPQPIRNQSRLVDDSLFKVDLRSVSPGNGISEAIRTVHVVGVAEGEIAIQKGPTRKAGEFCLIPASLKRLEISSATGAKVLIASL